jgi:lipoprotein-anchoring transpeptidase ErfK/SrfK
MLPAILVLIALVMILWFALIRPNKNPDQQANTSEQTNAAANLAENGNTNSTQPPVEISNSAPTRSLPGSGNRPDPQQEAENTIADSSALEEIQNRTQSRNQPQNQPQSQPQTSLNTPQNQPASTSLLDATRNQPTQTTQQPTTNTNRPSNSNTGPIGFQLDTAQRMVNQNDRVGARELLSRALHNIDPSSADGKRIRDALTEINRVLVFGPVVAPNDPMCEEYKIKSGDSLSRIASRRELATHWKLIQRVNRIANPSRIRLDQTIKLVRGPFHAVVYKSKHRMDIYHGSPNNPDQWLFITSLNVGLGADNGTPLGVFTISTNKLENPGWVNPRDASERYTPDDPANPIGEYWLGLDGVGEYATLTGYGIHGTIDPDSIGDDQSMGCVRLADQDIALVYELLAERVSVVEIRP